MADIEKIKSHLVAKLHEDNAFGSFDKSSGLELDDRNLIKYVLKHLDFPEIDLLFEIYPEKKIKRVWLDELVVPRGNLRDKNIRIVNLYFDIKNPVPYLERMATYYWNQKITDDLLKMDPFNS